MYHVLKKEQYKITQWSGGDTVEILIFPAGASFEKKDFDIRISRAMLYQEQSQFTILPNYQRKLISLYGHVTLEHYEENGVRRVQMSPGKQDIFAGDDKTISYGSGADFNFIYKDQLTTQTEIIKNHQPIQFNFKPYYFYLIHSIHDLIEVEIEPENEYLKDNIVLKNGDSLLIYNEDAKFSFHSATIEPVENLAIMCEFDITHNRNGYHEFIQNFK